LQADWYEPFEMFAIQTTVTCLAMTDAGKASRILEVGCGSGAHSEFIAKNYLKKGGLLVSCDLSNCMIKKVDSRY
jgi:ubiquinone/menaquinone biosynthesis C-methylase UbiE